MSGERVELEDGGYAIKYEHGGDIEIVVFDAQGRQVQSIIGTDGGPAAVRPPDPACPRCGSTEARFIDVDPKPDSPPEAFWPWWSCGACGHEWQEEER